MEHNQVSVSSNDTVPSGSDPDRRVILVIDDEEMILSLLQEVLDLEGYTVLLAMNGAAGLERVLEGHPDLVLTDMMMPIMDGHELCRRLRADQRTATIPLICMSAAYRPQADDAFDAIIAKPFDLDSLLALIHVWLGGEP